MVSTANEFKYDTTTTEPARLSVCIVSHNAYATVSGRTSGFIGGVEWQTTMLARWLAARGHKVTFLTWDEGGPQEEEFEGVRVIKVCPKRAGVAGLRFLHPKWTGLIAALRKADADVYYHNCGECVTGQIALWCRQNGRAFVFSSANDTDCDARLPELPLWRDRVLYRYGLRAADRLIVQTKTQRASMRTGLGVDAMVIPMPSRGPTSRTARTSIPGPFPRILWVARVCRQKRPDRLMHVAAAMPDITFDVVGPHYTDSCAQEALQHASRLPNVRVHGPLPRDQVAEKYRDSAVLLCTSDYEGFPNTFLEAWSNALPIVSTFDPDQLIQSRQLGFVETDVESLVASLRRMLNDPAVYQTMSTNCLSYYDNNHDADVVLPRFERVFQEVVARRKANG